jgi:hypothetical protein
MCTRGQCRGQSRLYRARSSPGSHPMPAFSTQSARSSSLRTHAARSCKQPAIGNWCAKRGKPTGRISEEVWSAMCTGAGPPDPVPVLDAPISADDGREGDVQLDPPCELRCAGLGQHLRVRSAGTLLRAATFFACAPAPPVQTDGYTPTALRSRRSICARAAGRIARWSKSAATRLASGLLPPVHAFDLRPVAPIACARYIFQSVPHKSPPEVHVRLRNGTGRVAH